MESGADQNLPGRRAEGRIGSAWTERIRILDGADPKLPDEGRISIVDKARPESCPVTLLAGRTEQQLRRSVPSSEHLVGQLPVRAAVDFGQAEIRQLWIHAQRGFTHAACTRRGMCRRGVLRAAWKHCMETARRTPAMVGSGSSGRATAGGAMR